MKVKYQLPYQILLYKFTFISADGPPKVFYLVASNDDTTWVELSYYGTYSGNKYTGIITSPTIKYKYYGIVINQIHNNWTTSLADFRLYGTIM